MSWCSSLRVRSVIIESLTTEIFLEQILGFRFACTCFCHSHHITIFSKFDLFAGMIPGAISDLKI